MALLTKKEISERYPDLPHLWECADLEDFELETFACLLRKRQGKVYLKSVKNHSKQTGKSVLQLASLMYNIQSLKQDNVQNIKHNSEQTGDLVDMSKEILHLADKIQKEGSMPNICLISPNSELAKTLNGEYPGWRSRWYNGPEQMEFSFVEELYV
jgi:hypothetical protein